MTRYIVAQAVAARQLLETQTRRQLVTATWKLSLDRFPGCNEWCNHAGEHVCCSSSQERWHRSRGIELPVPPLQSVTSITYVDSNGDTQTLATDQYQVDALSTPGRVLPAYGVSWPTTRCQANAVNITFVAGYGLAAAVPATAKHAIKLLLSHWYENRESSVKNDQMALPMGFDALVWQLRWGSYA
jgi:uncharacterized phiE125 gp8 family phage protein